jgi:hypothetical protein
MRSARTLTIALGTASLMAVSGVAFAVVQSVDTAPAPQVVIPTSATHSAGTERGDDRGAARHGADDPANHDAGDDNCADDPATHDLCDDHGGATSGNDDPATHDVGDDHGGTTSGGGSGSGRGGSDDSGSGGHGSDG